LPKMPMKTSNNAVVEAFDGDTLCIYSFGGIDSTKVYSGIHKRAFKFSLRTQLWQELASIPDTSGKIASYASSVRNKIYIIGGYHVLANSNELSSNKVHIFNPITNQFEADGAPIPIPIDDHVQVVWRDSLIFVITGWSNSGNVANVQIYNPFLNQWTSGTPTPNNTFFKSFGASGTIIGDSIYYHGGARAGTNFPASSYLRKAIINATNPVQLTWTQEMDAPGAASYRAACSSFNDDLLWFGGSGVSYNYNGIAYNGSGGVIPNNRILNYQTKSKSWIENFNQTFSLMDLRGIAKITPSSWVLAGGMDNTQNVTDYVYLIKIIDPPANTNELNLLNPFSVYPIPSMDQLFIEGKTPIHSLEIFDNLGRNLSSKIDFAQTYLDISNLDSGKYWLKINRQFSYLIQKY